MRDYFKKLRRGESLEERARSGRPRKLISTLRRQLSQIKAKHPKEKTTWYARQLSRVRVERLSVTTAWRALSAISTSHAL